MSGPTDFDFRPDDRVAVWFADGFCMAGTVTTVRPDGVGIGGGQLPRKAVRRVMLVTGGTHDPETELWAGKKLRELYGLRELAVGDWAAIVTALDFACGGPVTAVDASSVTLAGKHVIDNDQIVSLFAEVGASGRPA